MSDEKHPQFWEGIKLILPKAIMYLILITMLVIARVGLNMSAEKPISKRRIFGIGVFSWFLGVSVGMICFYAHASQWWTVILGPTATALGHPLSTVVFNSTEKLLKRVKTISFWKIKVDFSEDQKDKKDVA